MRILKRSSKCRQPAEWVWRQEAQERVKNLLEKNAPDWDQMSPDAWGNLKGEWRDIVTSALSSVKETAGDPIGVEALGTKVYDGFRIEKLVLETQPGWLVGLNVFLPAEGEGPFIPVICPCGHSPKWFPDHYNPAQVLARSGFAAALFDMPMFGERCRDSEHFIQGAQSIMTGLWSNHFFLIDCVRVIDYLQTRSDMDFSRGMGMTGVSGGGLATMFLPLLDDRITVIGPTCSVVPLGGHLIDGLYTGCPENFLEGQARIGLNLHHLLALSSPLPCLINGGAGDQLFRPHWVEKAYDEIKALYAKEGAADRIELFIDPDVGHFYSPAMANRFVRWMNRWLTGEEKDCDIRETIKLGQEDVDCGTTEKTEGMLQVIRRRVAELKKQRKTSRIDLSDVLDVALPSRSDVCETIAPLTEWGRKELSRKILHADDKLPLPMLQIEQDNDGETLLIVSDEGKQSALRRWALPQFQRVVAADIRGFGELEPEESDYDTFAWCSIDRAISDLLFLCGRTPMAEQTEDVLRLLDHLFKNGTDPQRFILHGAGEAALPALFAGLTHPKVKRVSLESFLCSFESLATAEVPVWKRYQYLPNVLKHFDLPELLQSRTDRQYLLINPKDATGRGLDETTAGELYNVTDQPHLTLKILDSVPTLSLLDEWYKTGKER